MRVDECCGPEGVFIDKGDLLRPLLLSLKGPSGASEDPHGASEGFARPIRRERRQEAYAGLSAVDAARERVYKPTTLGGIPTKVETVLTFTFATGSQ
jgi:hypothetical protein